MKFKILNILALFVFVLSLEFFHNLATLVIIYIYGILSYCLGWEAGIDKKIKLQLGGENGK